MGILFYVLCVCYLCVCSSESDVYSCARGSQARTLSLAWAFNLFWDRVVCEFWGSPACLTSPHRSTGVTLWTTIPGFMWVVEIWLPVLTVVHQMSYLLSCLPSPMITQIYLEEVWELKDRLRYHQLIQTSNSFAWQPYFLEIAHYLL